jgi:autotransporter translocation and assembly factor TamB
VTLDMPSARLDLRARGRLAPRVQPEFLVLTATVPEVQTLLPGAPDVRGGVRLAVRGTGDREAWQAHVEADATKPRAGPWSASAVRLTGTATGTGLALQRAEARVVARGNELGPQRMGRVEVRARRPAPKRLGFEIDARDGEPIEGLSLRGSVTATSGVALRIGGGTLELAEATWTLAPFRAWFEQGHLAWRGLEATSNLGYLESSGQLRADPRRGDVEVRAQLDDLGVLPFVPVNRGSVGVSSQLSWDATSIRGRLDARAEGLSLDPIARPLSAEVHVEADELVRAHAIVRVPDGGTLEMDADVGPPTPWTDGPAWLDWDRLEAARLGLDEVALAAWLAADVDADGRLDGALKYDRDERELDVSLTARDVRAPGVEVPVELSVRGGVDDDGTSLSVDGELAEREALRLRGRVGVDGEDLPQIDELELRDRDWDVGGELPTLPLSLVARAAGLPRDWVETATGTLSVSFAANSQPHWRARLSARAEGEIRSGAPALDAGVNVDLAADRLVATASVTGEGFGAVQATYRVDADHERNALERWNRGRLDASIRQLALTGIRSLVVLPADLRGRVDGSATWNLETDDGRIEVGIPELTVHQTLAPLALGLNGTWTSTGTRASLRLTPKDASDSLTASIELRDGLLGALAQPAEVGARGGWSLDELDAGALIREQLDRQRFAGGLCSTGTITGTLGAPEIAGELRWTDARIGRQSFERFIVSGETSPQRTRALVDLREAEGGKLRVRLDGTSTDARGEATEIHVSASRFSVDFLSDLAAMATGATAQLEGMLSADLHLVGTEDPSLRGGLTLSDVRIVMPGAVPRLNDTRIEVTTSGRNVEIDLAGRSGASGRLELQSQLDLSNLRAPSLTGSISGRRVEFLAGILPLEINFDIGLDGRAVEEHFALDVTIRNSTIMVTERDIESTYAPIRSTPDVIRVETFGVRPIEVSATTPSISSDPLQLVIRVRNADPINFRGKDAQGVIQIDTRVDVRSATTRISGTTSISDGTIALFGREYRVVQAIVRFTERSPPNPQLDIQLTHAFDTLTLTVNVSGRAQNPNVRFTSDPGTYDESQLLSFFAGLSNPDQEGPAGPASEQAAGAAAGLLLGPVTKQVRKNLPIDTFDVSMGNNAPVVTVGKWLSDELFLAYTWTTQAEPTEDEQSGLIRWRFYPGWVMEVIAGPIQQSADVFWIKRF